MNEEEKKTIKIDKDDEIFLNIGLSIVKKGGKRGAVIEKLVDNCPVSVEDLSTILDLINYEDWGEFQIAENEDEGWIESIEESHITLQRVKVFQIDYKGFFITVYPVREYRGIDENGWEYSLYRNIEGKENVDWESIIETPGYHAKDPNEAMKWAITTVDEWED